MERHRQECLCPLCELRREVRGWAETLRGSVQPSEPGVVQASGRYQAGQLDIPTDEGVLGRTFSACLGLFDTRPDLEKPARWDDNWYRRVTPILGDGLTLRVEQRRDDRRHPLDRNSLSFADPWRNMAVSVLVSAGDSFPADFLNQQVASRDPFYIGPDPWTPNRNARFGPNLIPALSTRGVAEVDLLRWGGRGRFVCAWLSAYWLVENPTDPLDLVWQVWDYRTESADWGPIAVSVPILSVVDGPWDEADDTNALWRQGSFPLSAKAEHRLSVVNGGATGVTLETRWSSGPMVVGAWTGPTDVFAIAGGRSEERTRPVGADGTAVMSVWGTNTEDEGGTGGPLILTCTQGSTR